ncbi:MAG: hypothetical protein ACLQVI_38425 [Polyangiaceae bacterium]|jgi:hypothetical protein
MPTRRDPDADALVEDVARPLARASVGPGRVGTYAVLGAAAGSVPLPWLPDAFTRRVRGALAQDIAARHGLSITLEARDLLSEPAGTEGPRGVGAQAMRFVTRRLLGRFGPLGIVPPIRSGLETFVLGHLFARYLAGLRTEHAARIDVEEARELRRAIDRALVLAVSPEVHGQMDTAPHAPEELRDTFTQVVDGVLMTFAGAPEWMLRRIEAAFDEAIARRER